MASSTDIFAAVLMAMQGTFNLNDLPDSVINYFLAYRLADPLIPDQQRREGLRHIIRALNLTPGDEDYNIFDRVTLPLVLVDLFEIGFDPYLWTHDHIMLHQTRLNVYQWAALLEIGYDLCSLGVMNKMLPQLPPQRQPQPEPEFNPNTALFSLMITLIQLPANFEGLNESEIRDLSKLIYDRIEEMPECVNFGSYLNYLNRVQVPSRIGIRLLSAVSKGLKSHLD
jgi:hypothetical protein